MPHLPIITEVHNLLIHQTGVTTQHPLHPDLPIQLRIGHQRVLPLPGVIAHIQLLPDQVKAQALRDQTVVIQLQAALVKVPVHPEVVVLQIAAVVQVEGDNPNPVVS